MTKLTYTPLFFGVFVLQAITAATVALSRFESGRFVLAFAVGCIALIGIALVWNQQLRARGYTLRPADQVLQVIAVATITIVAYRLFDLRVLLAIFGLALIVARDVTLTDRRALYLDLAIVLALFYDAIGGAVVPGRVLPYRLGIATAFLMALIFVLMADYTDRRLAYVRVGDTRKLTAVLPGLRNTAFAGVVVMALAALIYMLMPQPSALGVGIFPDRGPPARFGRPDPDHRKEHGTSNNGDERKPVGNTGQPGKDGPKGPAGGDGDTGKGKAAPGPAGKGGGLGPNDNGSTGPGDAGKGPGGPGDAGPGPGGAGKPGKGSAGQGESGKGAGGPGKGRGGGTQPGTGAKGPSDKPGTDVPGPVDKPGDIPGGRHPGEPNRPPPRLPPKLDLAGNDFGGGAGDKEAGKKDDGGKDKKDGKENDKKDEKKKESDKDKKNDKQKDAGGKSEAPPEKPELVLFFMDADRPLYLRTHVFVKPEADGWAEQPLKVTRAQKGAFERTDIPPAGVRQHYKVMQKLDERIATAYSPARLVFPAPRLRFNHDMLFVAPRPLERETVYSVVSAIEYVEGRPIGPPEQRAGPAEGVEPQAYLALPPGIGRGVEALAREVTREHDTPLPKAVALERHLRAHYERAQFRNVAGRDPVEQFLFEQRAGGSRQFAGALAVLLRTIGIPSRIVAGYRARRLNPLHGNYEIWIEDRHYWVEAHLVGQWVTFEPSPWATLPAQQKPATALESAREYVRLATERSPDVATEGGGGPPPEGQTIPWWYLYLVLAWGWLLTYGKLVLLALIAAGIAAWRWRVWSRPLYDALDRRKLREVQQKEPAQLVRTAYETVERLCTRRTLARSLTENHAEYLNRIARTRPHLQSHCRALAVHYAAARYGTVVSAGEAAVALEASRTIADLIDEKVA